jgi:hypothetical protein
MEQMCRQHKISFCSSTQTTCACLLAANIAGKQLRWCDFDQLSSTKQFVAKRPQQCYSIIHKLFCDIIEAE